MEPGRRGPGGRQVARRVVVLVVVVLAAALLGRIGSGLNGPAGGADRPAGVVVPAAGG